MNFTILSSTLLLTLLLLVGLFFFIRASTKDRTQEVTMICDQPDLLMSLQQYMQQRSYKLVKVDAENNSVMFEGNVRPSVFLAIFLTTLATIGIFCLVLVLSQLFPSWSQLFLSLVLLSPAAGVFYWKKAARNEQVLLKLDHSNSEAESGGDFTAGVSPADPQLSKTDVRQFTVIAHRDEIIELKRSLPLKSL